MKKYFIYLLLVVISPYAFCQKTEDISTLQKFLDRATATIRSAFENGDIELILKLHGPDIEKYFGRDNVVRGRDSLRMSLEGWFENEKVEFVENKVESTIFSGRTAIQTVIFGIMTTPKDGGEPVVGRGRSLVVYEQDKNSPTGWLSLYEMVQEAPPL